MNVRSAILPLRKRYRTSLLFPKLSRLSVKFYTDTLFVDNTSVQGNKFVQLYADRDRIVNIFPMWSKAGSGDSPGNVVKYIGIKN